MGTGYTRQSAAEIAPGETITAVAIENEFDTIEAAFNSASGHTHDGTTGEGPKISLTTSISGILPIANGGIAGIHKLNGTTAPTINDDSGDGYSVGSLWVDTTADNFYIAVDVTVGAAVWKSFQPLDADLTAIAGLTSAADKVPYFTGVGTAAVADFPAYGRAIAASASEAAFKAGVNLEIGTDVQAWSTNLDDWSSVALLDFYTAADVDLILADYQPLDADLTAIAALTTDAAGRSILTLTDPGADRLAFWDDSVGSYAHLTLGEGLTITDAELNAETTQAATTDQAGTVELATDEEVRAGVATDRAVTVSNLTHINYMPVGCVVPYAGVSLPPRWLFCYGQAVSRTDYSELFTWLSTTYGAGDGSTTFNLPDLRGRVVAGQDDMGGTSANRLTSPINGDTLGAAGGVEAYVLVTGELPAHTHTQQGTFASGGASADHTHTWSDTATTSSSGAHTHTTELSQVSPTSGIGTGTGGHSTADGVTSSDGAHTHSVTVSGTTSGHSATHTHNTTISGATTSTGSNTAHDNVQPTIILNYIIYTGAV